MASSPATAAELASQLLEQSGSDLGIEERRVLENIAAGNLTSRDAADVADAQATFGERLSDRVAAVGGSWAFIIAFAVFGLHVAATIGTGIVSPHIIDDQVIFGLTPML